MSTKSETVTTAPAAIKSQVDEIKEMVGAIMPMVMGMFPPKTGQVEEVKKLIDERLGKKPEGFVEKSVDFAKKAIPGAAGAGAVLGGIALYNHFSPATGFSASASTGDQDKAEAVNI